MNARNKKRWMIVSVAVTVLAAAIVIHWLANRAPSYEGKDISYWFKNSTMAIGFRASAMPLPDEPAFRAMGPAAVPYLTMMLKEDNLIESVYWTQWLKHWRQMPHWLQNILPRPMQEIYRQTRAAILLEETGLSGKAAVPELIRLYKVAYARDYKSAGAKTNAAGIPISGSLDGQLRERVVRALASVGAEDPRTVPLLVFAMNEPDFFVRNQTETVLRDINLVPAVKKSVPGLIDMLNNPQGRTRYSAAAILGLVITERHEIILPLVRALSDDDETVRFAAGNSLRRAGRDTLVPVLHDALHGKDDRLRWNAALFLNEWGPDEAKGAISVLIEILGNDRNDRSRAMAAILLGYLGPEAREALRALTLSLQDPVGMVRDRAAEALNKIRP